MQAPSEPEYRLRHRTWLGNFNFSADPFSFHEAETETLHDLLPYFFVERPYFDVMFGDPTAPCPGFLFAGRGAGKTATLKMVARRCNPGAPGQRALPVPYDDFGPLLNEVGGDLHRITATTHVHGIIRAVTKALPEIVPSSYWEALPAADRPLLSAYVRDFGYPMTQATLVALIGSEPLMVDWERLTPREILSELARILIRLQPPPLPGAPQQVEDHRFRSIYILVDRIDESSLGPAGALALLLPLVRDQLLINTPNVALKFFLPAGLEQQLQDAIDLRLDRTPSERIVWDTTTLQEMVDRRVQYYSDNQVASFGELCHSSAQQCTMARLIEEAQGSPRTLIRLCHGLIEQAATTGEPLIHPEDVDRAIAEFRRHRETEAPVARLEDPGTPPEAPGFAVRLHRTLLHCGPFESNETLSHTFSDPRIRLWRDRLGECYTPDERVRGLCALLQDRYNRAGENGLVLFLQVLVDQINPQDACHAELQSLVEEAKRQPRE